MSLSTSKAARNKDTGQSAMPLRLSEGPAKTTYQVTFRVCPTFHTVPAVGYVTGGTNTSEVERDATVAPRTGCMASARSAATGASFANIAGEDVELTENRGSNSRLRCECERVEWGSEDSDHDEKAHIYMF